MESTFTRRSFVSGVAAGSAAALLGSPLASSGSALAEEEAAPEWLGTAPEITEESIVEEVSTDILIVGAGNVGMAAAATAAEMGLDFVLCEKFDTVQDTRHWVGGVNTSWQADADVEIDAGKVLNELVRYAEGRCRADVIKVWVDESAETLAFTDGLLAAVGMECSLDTEDYGNQQGGTDYYCVPTQHMWRMPEEVDASNPYAGFKSSKHRNQVFADRVEELGYRIRYEHTLVRLDQDGTGRVTGGVFETDGGYVRIAAAKGVLLATGGYPANPLMMSALSPTAVASCTAPLFSPKCQGDGIRCGIWAGGVHDTDYAPMIFDRGATLPGMNAGYEGEGASAHFTGASGRMFIGSQPFMKVNRNGKRFMNESAPYDFAAFAASRQPGGVWASIMDADAPAAAVQNKVVGCAKMGTFDLNKAPMDEVYAELIESGVMVRADTLEELAAGLGLPVDAFLEEVERYNGFCDAQADEDFGKEAYRLTPVRTAPFYGFWCGGSLLTTCDGLQIDADMRVLGADMRPIEGLFAAGDCSGSFFSGNYPEFYVGVAVGRSITEGRHAVRYMAEQQ